MGDYLRLNTLTKDGALYENPALDTVEALISNEPYRSCHAADLLELDNGDMLCCWFAGSAEGNGDISIVLARLNAGESQWSRPVQVTGDGSKSEQNPSLFLTPAGEIWLVYTAQEARTPGTGGRFNLQYTAEIRCKKSLDGGYTWGKEEVLFSRKGSFCRQKIQVLADGRWVFGNWICFNDETHNGSDVSVVQISDDQGKSWREVLIPGSGGRVHANITELAPGRLAAFFRSRFADFIYRSVSEDNGETWSEPVRTELPNNNSSISVIRLQNGHLAAAFNPVSFSDDASKTLWPALRCPITFAVSEDGGETWPYRRTAEPGDGYTGAWNEGNNRRYEYPVILQGRSGKIHGAWSWGDRASIKYVCVDEMWIRGREKKAGLEKNPTLEEDNNQ